jgi:hypothetical protein
VLALRFALVGSLGAIALWGLFSLLDNLKEPELLRSDRAVVLKGCDPMETQEARQRCPGLRCQKALLDAKLVPLRATLEVQDERVSASERLVVGSVSSASQPLQEFACLLEGDQVTSVQLLSSEEIDELLAQDGEWELGTSP